MKAVHKSMIIKTKLNAPKISKEIVYRQNIAEKILRINEYKLVLVTAPAGFGKTTFIASYLYETCLLHAWLSIDQEDNDPVKFWRGIIASLEEVSNCSRLLQGISVNRELIASGMIIGLIVDQLYALSENLLIILDDFHLIQDELIRKSMDLFIKYLPANITVVILSRVDLSFKLAESYVRGQVLKIGAGDLSFSLDEISEFFKIRAIPLTNDEVSVIRNYTEGWAAGLVVTALSIRANGNLKTVVTQFPKHNRYIDNFIKEELFDNWTEKIKEFLIETSFIDKLSGPICEAITGYPDAGEILKYLADGNSLIFRMDDEDQWFRYHQIFRDFLEKKLAEKGQDYKKGLYFRAGEWYCKNKFNKDAISSFIKAGEFTKAFLLLVDKYVYLEMAQNGEIADWCKLALQIPEDCPNGYYKEKIQTYCAFAWVQTMENHLEEAVVWLDKSQTLLEKIDTAFEKEKQFLQAHIEMNRAAIGICKMDAEQVLYYLKRIAGFEMYQPILLGEMNPGEPRMLNTIYAFKGRLNMIDSTYSILIKDIPRIIGDFSAYVLIILAELFYERNKLEEAYQSIIQGMESILGLNNPGVIVPCFITLASIKRANGDINGAFNTVLSGREKINGRNKYVWDYNLNVFTAELYLDMKDTASAEEWLNLDRIDIYDNLSCTREYEYIVFSKLLVLKKQYDDALLLLTRLLAFVQKEGRLKSHIHILCLLAICHWLRMDIPKAIGTIDNALDLSIEHGYLRTIIDEREFMVEILEEYANRKRKSPQDEKYKYVKLLLRLANRNISLYLEKNPTGKECRSYDNIAKVLSPREYKVLQLLVSERSNSEIADELCITVRTVKHHNSRIFEKLSVKNRLEAIIKARESGLL